MTNSNNANALINIEYKDESEFPLVSIITATYNSERFIHDTYDSIKNQTHNNWEWIVTDDCSTDNTYNALCDIALKDPRVKIYRNNVNSGAAVSRNNSIKMSRGDYIAFIDSDDLWRKNKLERQLLFMGNDIDFSFTAYETIDEVGNEKKQYIDSIQREPLNYKDMLKKHATLGCSTVILRSSAFNKIEMPLIRTGQDYATWLRILKSGKQAHLFPEILTKYRIVSGSISRNKFKKALRQWEIYRRIEKLNPISSCYYFIHYAVRALIR